jgi:arsenite-transporting ATPase
MEMERFCATSRVVIVAGKGGVGKTTTTAALAVAAARTGASVLIVEVEGKSGLSACFGAPPLEYDDAELSPGVRARTLTPDRALLEYLEDRGLRRISKRLVRSGALDVVATAVPGMKDILVLGKVKQLEQGNAADLILIDAPAAGHAISFLMSPRGLLDAVRMGPVRSQAEGVIAMLSDPARCRVMMVTLPEETPVNELVDTAFTLEDRVGVKLGPVVVNAMPAELPLAGCTAAQDAATARVPIPRAELVALDDAAGRDEVAQGVVHAAESGIAATATSSASASWSTSAGPISPNTKGSRS